MIASLLARSLRAMCYIVKARVERVTTGSIFPSSVVNGETLMESGKWTINDLVNEFGVSRATIHRYVTKGLLPRPNGYGRGATYSNLHVNRLLEIRRELDRRVTLRDLMERYRADE